MEGLATGVREFFRDHGGDAGHSDFGDRIIEHPADASSLRLTAGGIRTAKTKEPGQPATFLLLVGLLHGTGDFFWGVILRIEAIAGATLQLPSQLPALLRAHLPHCIGGGHLILVW